MSNKQMEMMAREHDMSGIDQQFAEQTAHSAAKATVTGYKKIENGVVTGYRKMETGVVAGFGKVVDKCVEKLFAKEGETIEEAKTRLQDKHNRENQ